MLDNYVREYGDDPGLEILAIEQPFELELVRDGKTIAIFIGIFDGVAYDHDDDLLVLLEHKTATAIKTVHLPLDKRQGLVLLGCVHCSSSPASDLALIEGVSITSCVSRSRDPRPRNAQGAYLNKNGEVSKVQTFRRSCVSSSTGVRARLRVSLHG